jgi:FkbM family methyltransferase
MASVAARDCPWCKVEDYFLVKSIIKAILRRTPYRIVRDRGFNRFNAIDDQLLQLKRKGYEPRVVIDGGAHLGSFSLSARKLWPHAAFHLIEPQAACDSHLRSLCDANGFELHSYALADTESARQGTVRFTVTETPNTGAQAIFDGVTSEHQLVEVPAVTLDSLLAGKLQKSDRAFLKLDLQGSELAALKGGIAALANIEVILTEVSLWYSPTALDIMCYLRDMSFEWYDVAALNGRTRDNRLCQGDLVFVRADSNLAADRSWE